MSTLAPHPPGFQRSVRACRAVAGAVLVGARPPRSRFRVVADILFISRSFARASRRLPPHPPHHPHHPPPPPPPSSRSDVRAPRQSRRRHRVLLVARERHRVRAMGLLRARARVDDVHALSADVLGARRMRVVPAPRVSTAADSRRGAPRARPRPRPRAEDEDAPRRRPRRRRRRRGRRDARSALEGDLDPRLSHARRVPGVRALSRPAPGLRLALSAPRAAGGAPLDVSARARRRRVPSGVRRALLRDSPRDASTPGGVSTRARQGTKYIYSPSRTLVPTRPRSRGARRSSRTLRFGFDPDTPRRLSTPPLTPFDSAPPRPRRPRRTRSTTPTPTSARATSFG